MSLSWHDLGLLGSAGSTTYTYDTSGKRLSKTVNGTTTQFYYAGDLLVGQKKGNEVIEFMFDSKGDYFGLEYNGTPYYYIKNLQGDVIAICNNAGNTVVTYEYDAWGKLVAYTDTTGFDLIALNPIRYRSYYFDRETGFYYLKSRYYAPEICRFISADVYISTGTGLNGYNMFAYCNNNPVKYVDNNGSRPVIGVSTENETPEEKFLSFAIMNRVQVKTIPTDYSGTLYVKDNNGLNNTNSASTKALINNSGDNYFVIFDNRNNGYIEILNSYKNENIAKQADILNAISKYTQKIPSNNTAWNRTVSSMFIEWTWHNLFYKIGIMRSSAQSACFDMYPYCNTDCMPIQVLGELIKRYGE